MLKLEALDFTAQSSKHLATCIIEMQEEKCRQQNDKHCRPELLEATERGLDRCSSIRQKKNYAIEMMSLYRRLGHKFDSMPWLDLNRPIVDTEWDYGYCSHVTSTKRGLTYYMLFAPAGDGRFHNLSTAIKAKYYFCADGRYGRGHYFGDNAKQDGRSDTLRVKENTSRRVPAHSGCFACTPSKPPDDLCVRALADPRLMHRMARIEVPPRGGVGLPTASVAEARRLFYVVLLQPADAGGC
jgi:hypothetical protein